MAELQRKQQQDSNIGKLLAWKKQGMRPSGPEVTAASPELRHYWNYWNSLETHNGLLYRRTSAYKDTDRTLQLLVPREIRRELVDSMHDSVFGGHLGTKKTMGKILHSHYWYNLRDDVKVWVKRCDTCAANKRPQQKPMAPMGDMRTGAPMDRLAVDVMGPLPLSHKGNQYVQVITDAFTKWVEIQAIPDQTALTCAEHLVAAISRFGCPLTLHSDQGRNYEGKLIKELCKLLEIKKTRTTPRRPQCNGQTERFNRTLTQMIKAYIKGEQQDWDSHLDCLAAAYRASKHETTGFTPNFLMLGREVRLPGDVAIPQQNTPASGPAEYVDKMRERLHTAHQIARQHLKASTERQKERYDSHSCSHNYQRGDLIWYRNEVRKEGICPKLEANYVGPYLVLSNYNSMDFLIQKNKHGRPTVVHHDKLKPYEGTAKLKWAKAVLKREL